MTNRNRPRTSRWTARDLLPTLPPPFCRSIAVHSDARGCSHFCRVRDEGSCRGCLCAGPHEGPRRPPRPGALREPPAAVARGFHVGPVPQEFPSRRKGPRWHPGRGEISPTAPPGPMFWMDKASTCDGSVVAPPTRPNVPLSCTSDLFFCVPHPAPVPRRSVPFPGRPHEEPRSRDTPCGERRVARSHKPPTPFYYRAVDPVPRTSLPGVAPGGPAHLAEASTLIAPALPPPLAGPRRGPRQRVFQHRGVRRAP